MKRLLLALLTLAPVALLAQPCTTTNGLGCLCPGGVDTCDLLPDITISWDALENYLSGPSEYPQTGAGADNGRLRVTGSTPNIGFGPFTVRGTDYYMCGGDTIYSPGGLTSCPDGSSPTNLLHQRVYVKEGPDMVYYDRWAGSQTYHPTHGHNHVDDWVVFTLRMEDPGNPDTLSWPIIGDGAKIGFCLMDYGDCDYYWGHCRDNQHYGSGTIMGSVNLPNYGLGGGGYGCSPVEQGISAGYTDIYSEYLDGMWIDVPPTTCNGDYWIVVEVDPRNVFMESNEDNNWTAIPFTLTQQLPAGTAVADITMAGEPVLCSGKTVELSSSTALSYLWSTGDTTQTIAVNTPGDYYVQATSACGIGYSDTVTIASADAEVTSTTNDSTCQGSPLVLEASGLGDLYWYDSPGGSIPIATGNSYTTPILSSSTTYYVEAFDTVINGVSALGGPADNTIGGGGFFTGDQYLEFDAHQDFVLKSVKVYANGSGYRTIELRNSMGTVLESVSANIPDGESRVDLDMDVPAGTNLQLGWLAGSNPDLFRNNSGPSYPYSVGTLATINTSSAGTDFYYCYYDWEAEIPELICNSGRQPVEAVVNPYPTASMSGLAATYLDSDVAVSLTASPAGGTFSGPGMSGNTFDPALAGEGGPYTITYVYTTAAGCSDTATMSTTVQHNDGVGIEVISLLQGIQLYPNPANEVVNVSLVVRQAANVEMRLLNTAGKQLMAFDAVQVATTYNTAIDVSHLAAGVYYLELSAAGERQYQKLVVSR